MANLPLNLSPESASEIALGTNAVVVIDGQPMASSYEIAQTFNKRHDDVLKRIRSIDCSPEFRARNFAETEQTQKIGATARKIPYYRMTFDGFVFLVGSFTGKKAAAFKEAYIARFNGMRDELIRRQLEAGQPTRLPLPAPLSREQQAALRTLINSRLEALPEAQRTQAAITCWSALKSKFGCTYKKIPQSQFTGAVSLVARLELGDGLPGHTARFADLIGHPLQGGERWMVSLGPQGQERYTPVPFDACVMTHQTMMQAIVTPGELPVSSEEIFEFAMAALKNIKARSDFQDSHIKQLTGRLRRP